MFKRTYVSFLIIIFCLASISCQKITPPSGTIGPLKKETIKTRDSIPAEYGNLVSVTSNSHYSNWAQLWFVKPDKTIVIVQVNFVDGHISEGAFVIPRP